MFNRSAFNRSPFNRQLAIETYLTAFIETASDVSTRLSLDFPVAIIFDSATDIDTELVREIPFAAEIETASELLTALIRELFLRSYIDTATEFYVKVSYSHVDELRFLGEFKPGDKLVIDTRKMTVTLNGQNVIHLLDGDFFEFALGNNLVTYSDGEGVRNILTRITHRDKFLY